MIMDVIWSSKALKSYDQVLAYLTSEWGKASVQKFMDEVEKVILLISQNPYMNKRSVRHKNIRIGYLTKQNSLVYRVKSKEIELLLFWDNRQDSKKLKY
jgi:plasmid stabilization system protein ParE